MRIVFFNRSYHPDPEATGQYLTELAEDLVARGAGVTVVCGRSYHVKKKWGFGPLKAEERNGVRVLRAFNTQLPKSSFLCRLVNLATYFTNSVLAVLFLPRPDVVVSETDPPLLPLLAGVYAKLVRARFVFAINDLYPDVAIELGEISNPIWLKLLDIATSFGLRRADLVTVLGEDMKARIVSKGCAKSKIAVAPYWVEPEHIKPCKENNEFRREHGIGPSDFVVMYSGNLGLSQDLEGVIRVATEFRNVDDVRFLIVGDGARKKRLQTMASRLNLDGKVSFLPYQPRARLAQSLSAADLHLIPLSAGVAGSVVPCKMYGIMASGTPYLAITDEESDVASVGDRYKCGLWCPPGSPSKLKELIYYAYSNRDLLREMGRKGRQAAETEFSRDVGTGRYYRLFTALGER